MNENHHSIKPHNAFNIIRPDEMAECWGEDVTDALYTALWACVAEYTAPSPKESEEPCWGVDCVADFWGKFSREQQEALNALAESNSF